MNLDILKIQYELFIDPQEIAIAHNLEVTYIQGLIKELKWEKNPLLLANDSLTSDLPQSTNPEKVLLATEQHVQSLKDKLTITSLLKQEILNPIYTQLETLLVCKAIETLNRINMEHPDAAKNIKTLTSVLNELLQNNANLTSAKETVDTTDNKVVVQIMNQVETSKE